MAAIFVAVCVAGVAGYRLLQTMSVGSGRYLDSPNEKYVAHAFNMYDESFWGGARRSYYHFSVEYKNGWNITSCEIPQPTNPIEFYNGPGTISWADDSSSVVFGDDKHVIWNAQIPFVPDVVWNLLISCLVVGGIAFGIRGVRRFTNDRHTLREENF